jgi:hypothetical protein
MPKKSKTPTTALTVRRTSACRVRHDPATLCPLILGYIAEGASIGEALAQLPAPAPSRWWFKDRLRHDPELKAAYDFAVECRAEKLADELVALADTPIPEGLDGPSKSAFVQQLRLRLDTRRWVASKLAPRRYGDHVEVNVQEARISITAALEAARQRVIGAYKIDDD